MASYFMVPSCYCMTPSCYCMAPSCCCMLRSCYCMTSSCYCMAHSCYAWHTVAIAWHTPAIAWHILAIACHSAEIAWHTAAITRHTAAIAWHPAAIAWHTPATCCGLSVKCPPRIWTRGLPLELKFGYKNWVAEAGLPFFTTQPKFLSALCSGLCPMWEGEVSQLNMSAILVPSAAKISPPWWTGLQNCETNWEPFLPQVVWVRYFITAMKKTIDSSVNDSWLGMSESERRI